MTYLTQGIPEASEQADQTKTRPPYPEFYGASDASFAVTEDRKSTQGIVYQLFGGTISYKSSKQTTVTKSSTEAELLALSFAGSELIYWTRLFAQIGLHLDDSSALYCDNQQTIRLITADSFKLNTALRHVDIHHHWLREQHTRGLKVDWVNTNQMVADGLTKQLPPQKHQNFIQLLGMETIPD